MRRLISASTGLLLLAFSGCASPFDPYGRPGNWVNTGATNADLAQQIANPADLIKGQSEPSSNGIAATAGLDKALSGGSAAGLQTTAVVVSAAGGD